jgi:hypothetical protein
MAEAGRHGKGKSEPGHQQCLDHQQRSPPQGEELKAEGAHVGQIAEQPSGAPQELEQQPGPERVRRVHRGRGGVLEDRCQPQQHRCAQAEQDHLRVGEKVEAVWHQAVSP